MDRPRLHHRSQRRHGQDPLPSHCAEDGAENAGENHHGNSNHIDGQVPGRHAVIPALYADDLEGILARVLEQRLENFEARMLSMFEQLIKASERATKDLAMITEREMAELIGCDPRTVRRLERCGTIPSALRIGGSKRWRMADVQTWLGSMGGRSRKPPEDGAGGGLR